MDFFASLGVIGDLHARLRGGSIILGVWIIFFIGKQSTKVLVTSGYHIRLFATAYSAVDSRVTSLTLS
jgi:hypothetical protein